MMTTKQTMDTASAALVKPWQTGKPPNEMVVEVEWDGAVIPVIAFYGRDGYHPHWRSQDGDKHWPVNAFARWRQR